MKLTALPRHPLMRTTSKERERYREGKERGKGLPDQCQTASLHAPAEARRNVFVSGVGDTNLYEPHTI